MAGILTKLTAFARSPQGQRAISTASRKAQEIARDPKTKATVDGVRSRLVGRRGGGGAGGGGAGNAAADGAAGGPTHTDDTEGGGPAQR